VVLRTIFKNVELGLLLLVFLLSQPNIHYKLHVYPYGWMIIDILILSITLGNIFHKKAGYVQSEKEIIILLLLAMSYFALWNASSHFSLPAPFLLPVNILCIGKILLGLFFYIIWLFIPYMMKRCKKKFC